MFLGNLSTANERKARKAKNNKVRLSESSFAHELQTKSDEEVIQRLRTNEVPIAYTEEGGTIPRDVLIDYLRTCTKMMLQKANMEEIVNDSFQKKIGLQLCAIEFQRDVLEHNFHIERNFGCKYLSKISATHENDAELIDAAKEFMLKAMHSYLGALRARSDRYNYEIELRPAANAVFDRKCMLEFFEGCNALMAMPETKEELRYIYKSTGALPNMRVIEMQRDVIKLMGFDPDTVIQTYLNRIPIDHKDDKELLSKVAFFNTCAEISCQLATLTDEQRAEFMKNIPPMMEHFPHMFIHHQRMAMQQQQQKFAPRPLPGEDGHDHVHHGHSHSTPTQSSPEDRAQYVEALKQSGVLNLLTSPQGREKVQQLSARVQTVKERVDSEVAEWSKEQCVEYFRNFGEHPVLSAMQSVENDPLKKIQTFVEMSDAELEEMMRFLCVLSKDNGAMVAELQHAGEHSGAMKNVYHTMSSLSNVRYSAPRAATSSHDHSHGHDHGHSHDHGGSCPVHGNHGVTINRMDVATSKGNQMDR